MYECNAGVEPFQFVFSFLYMHYAEASIILQWGGQSVGLGGTPCGPAAFPHVVDPGLLGNLPIGACFETLLWSESQGGSRAR